MDENEIELMDYLNILWKKKWLIIIPTSFLVIITGVISFILPQKWEIDAIIVPSKFLVQTESGGFVKVMVVDPKQIAEQINEATYDSIIASELNLDIRMFPKLEAENFEDTNLVRVFTKEKDAEKAKLILHSLFKHLKTELDGKADIEIKAIDAEIKSKEIEKSTLEEEIKGWKNKLNIVGKRKKEIEKEMGDTRKRIGVLEGEQLSNLKKKNRSETESLALLLYSNEIQQSLRYFNALNELLSRKRIEEQDINLEIENKEEEIKLIENDINYLNERKGRIDFAQLIKEPTSSPHPVSPNKKLNVLIAGILGLMIFTVLAFFLNYIEKQKIKG